jgi:hypothetical protein
MFLGVWGVKFCAKTDKASKGMYKNGYDYKFKYEEN